MQFLILRENITKENPTDIHSTNKIEIKKLIHSFTYLTSQLSKNNQQENFMLAS